MEKGKITLETLSDEDDKLQQREAQRPEVSAPPTLPPDVDVCRNSDMGDVGGGELQMDAAAGAHKNLDLQLFAMGSTRRFIQAPVEKNVTPGNPHPPPLLASSWTEALEHAERWGHGSDVAAGRRSRWRYG